MHRGGHGCGEWFAEAGGCVVPPDDSVALAEAVSARLDNPARARSEAAEVAAFTRSRLSWNGAAAEMESLYREVTAQAGARAGR